MGKKDPPVISQCGAPTVMHQWSALSDTGSTIRHKMETNGAHICSDAQSSHSRRKKKKNKTLGLESSGHMLEHTGIKSLHTS